MPFPPLFPSSYSYGFCCRFRRGAPFGSMQTLAKVASACKSHWITVRIKVSSMGPSRHVLAAALTFVGIGIVSGADAYAQSCKVEAPQMCSQWLWEEINGGIPAHLDCAGGNSTCIAIIKGDIKVNGYKRQSWGWHALADNFLSPASITVFVPNGCACDTGGVDCVCLYPPVGTKFDCPNLANPSGTPDCKP